MDEALRNNILFGQELTQDEEASCAQQTTYEVASSITPPLTITLYYVAGVEPDYTYLNALCTAKRQFPELVIKPIVGDNVQQGVDGLECETVKEAMTTDCTPHIIAACASQLVDFPTWIDCTVCGGGDPSDCICAQDDSKVEDFNLCVAQTHPDIFPSEILLNNAKAARGTSNPRNIKPILVFNGMQDACARMMFYYDPVKVVTALLQGNQGDPNNQGDQDNSDQ